MSKKYFDKLLTGTGTTNKEVKSKYGEKLMKSLGWDKGKGLGKNESGMLGCVQIKRREEGVGLNDDDGSGEGDPQQEKPANKTFKWNDQFWTKMYNSNIEKFAQIEGSKDKIQIDSTSSDDDSSDSESV